MKRCVHRTNYNIKRNKVTCECNCDYDRSSLDHNQLEHNDIIEEENSNIENIEEKREIIKRKRKNEEDDMQITNLNFEENCRKRKIGDIYQNNEPPYTDWNDSYHNNNNMWHDHKKERHAYNNKFRTDTVNNRNSNINNDINKINDNLAHYNNMRHLNTAHCEQEDVIDGKRKDSLESIEPNYNQSTTPIVTNTYYLKINIMLKQLHEHKLRRNH